MDIRPIIKIIANNPTSILITLGGIGWLFSIANYGLFLVPGIGLQIYYLATKRPS